jgi:hydrogenase nickel incorporation protein HypA/HybF
MHEWALAEAVITTASQIAEKEGLREVTQVKIRIGEMQGIERNIFDFALSQLKPNKFKKTKFEVRTEKAELKCRACGHEWPFNKNKLDKRTAEAIHFVPEVAHTYIRCPKCRSPDFEMTEGRGVWLETIRGVK